MIDWYFITHLGNSVLLLPLALAIAVGLWVEGRRRLAARWMAIFTAAVALVVVSKLAFLGWGIGSRALDFTGISGHSTLSAAVLPMLGWWLANGCRRWMRTLTFAAGLLLALAIGWSRLLLHAHSGSEVIIGALLGLCVTSAVTAGAGSARRGTRLAWAVVLCFALAGAVPVDHEPGHAHGLIVWTALQLSGRSEPFSREMLQAD